METKAFNPAYGSNTLVTLAAATEQHFRLNKENPTLRVMNTGATNPLYFKTYASGTNAIPPLAPPSNASTADCRVNQGASIFVSYAFEHDAISLISTAGTTVEFMTGSGGI